MTLYERIKECARERKISITNLEKELGFGNGTIGKWQTNKPSLERLQKVADYFGKPLEWFLYGDAAAPRNVGNHYTNSINESDNAILVISQTGENAFTKQEVALIAAYRELSLEQQAEVIQFIFGLKRK